jgi:hypothetical protein
MSTPHIQPATWLTLANTYASLLSDTALVKTLTHAEVLQLERNGNKALERYRDAQDREENQVTEGEK